MLKFLTTLCLVPKVLVTVTPCQGTETKWYCTYLIFLRTLWNLDTFHIKVFTYTRHWLKFIYNSNLPNVNFSPNFGSIRAKNNKLNGTCPTQRKSQFHINFQLPKKKHCGIRGMLIQLQPKKMWITHCIIHPICAVKFGGLWHSTTHDCTRCNKESLRLTVA